MSWLVVAVPVAVGVVASLVLGLRSAAGDVINDASIDDQVAELPPLIGDSHESVRMATDFDPRLFDRKEMQAAIDKAIRNGAEVRMISEGDPPSWYVKRVGVQIRHSDKLATHVTIVDSRHTRVEKPHEFRRFGLSRGDTGVVFTDFPQLAEKHGEVFDRLWKSLS